MTTETETKATHTPGQWEHIRNGAALTLQWLIKSKSVTVGFVSGQSKAGKAEANARLIAAAPDLLAACEMVIGCVDHQSNKRPDEVTLYHDEIGEIRAAIRAAKGGAA